MRRTALLLFAAASAAIAASPKIYVVHTSKEVCAYISPIIGQPCRQAVLVAVDSEDAATEGFKVSLTYRNTAGAEKTLSQMVDATVYYRGAKASAVFYLDDVTVIAATAAVVAPTGEVGKYPEVKP